ncbi:MAG: AMP-binding protein [Kiloniellales bacterium]|nr:AMP-binding protein [Kiloniellales bacterium]
MQQSYLDPRPANFTPLSPLSFLRRCRDIYTARPAVIYGNRRYSWADVYERTVRLAAALAARGVRRGDTVSIIAANTPELFEAHFAVPMAGAVLNTINTRLDPDTIAYILGHGEAKLLIADTQFSPAVKAALGEMGQKAPPVIDIVDEMAQFRPGEGKRLGNLTYEELLSEGEGGIPAALLPDREWDTIALNYTSGTSGRPKGVLYHHRGAYLMSLGTVTAWGLPPHPTYLYTVPMFHCNGWGHAWTMAALAGTVVCCRYVNAKNIFDAIAEHKVTHFGGAPIVLSMLINAPEEERRRFDHSVRVLTAGAPPPAAVLEKTKALGFDVMQVYGLTETYGHVVQCAWQEQWDNLPFGEQAEIAARQGVRFPMMEDVAVIDQASGEAVPCDGQTMGEVVLRGNCVMKGYHKSQDATEEVFAGGWFHSGDLAVVHPDGYLQVKDRLKDIIISGGENISSVEVESVLFRHPAVAMAAVVARPDEKWGESPCAFVELQPGGTTTEEEIIAFCRKTLAGFKAPKTVIFGDLPKTSTGKIEKYKLRQRAREL